MGKRGPKPKGKVKIHWSAKFAYTIGLIATDGCLSRDGRHIIFVSEDYEQLKNFQVGLKITIPISYTRSGYSGRQIPRVQFGDVLFWNFLHTIGITPNKSKTIKSVCVPPKYFFDFVRGCFDGDGTFHSYWDPRWKSSFAFYIIFASASPAFIMWLRGELDKRIGVKGHITRGGRSSVCQLKYAKRESSKIIKNMYYSDSVICLSRKRKKIETALKVAETGRQMPR